MDGGGLDGGLAPHQATPKAQDGKRPVKAVGLIGVEPGMVQCAAPVFEEVDPLTLLVDGAYQRALSDRSLMLIRKIVRNWDWRRFKPPIVALTEQGLEVIDGQHTAIAAATHPGIAKIPVMIVEAAEQSSRASAFVGHNRDRLGLTPMQMHHAAVAAGDEDAQTIDLVCARAGATILRSTPANGVWKPRETVAVRAIGSLINRLGAQKARICLQVLADAECSPIMAGQLKAVEMLLHEPEYAEEIDPADLTSAIIALGEQAAQDAAVFAAAHKLPLWRALGVTWFKKARHGRRRSR
jgi:hypothetical protein